MLLVGKINEALIAARMINETYGRPRAFIWIAEAIMRIEDKDEAKAIIDEGLAATGNIPDLQNRLSYISPFYIALTTIEKVDDAKRVFDEASIMVRKIGNPRTRVGGLLSLFESQVKVGKLDEAATILDELYSLMRKVVNPAIIPGDFILLAQAKAKLGKEDEAKRLLNEGSAALQKITNVVRQGKGQVELAKTMIQFGMIDEASKTLDDALSSARTFNQYMAYRGDYRYDIIMEVVSALAKIRKLEYALTLAHSLETADSKISTFTGIAKAMSDAGRIEEAKRLIDDTLVLARKTEQPSFSCHPVDGYQARTLTSLAEILVKIGKTEEARIVALEALAGARNIHHSEDRVPALIVVAEVLDKCSDKHTKR
jgi:tetratricopeptide (TPR) repeat protein